MIMIVYMEVLHFDDNDDERVVQLWWWWWHTIQWNNKQCNN